MSYRLTGFMRFIEIWNVWFQDLYWSFMWWLHSCRFPLRRRMKALSSESMESGRWGVGLMQKMDPTWSNIQCILRFGCTVLTKATVMVTTCNNLVGAMNSWSDLWSAGNSCQAWICEIRWTLTSQTVLQNKWMRLALTAELVPLRRWKFSMTECWPKSLLSNAWWKLGSSFYRVESYGVYYQKPCCLFFFQVSSESRFTQRGLGFF